MTQKPAAAHETPVPESQTQTSAERDTLNDTPELRFLRDEIEALLGSPTVRRTGHTPVINYAGDHAGAPAEAGPSDEIADEDTAKFDASVFERDTEPSVDVQLLREAVRAAGNK